MEFTIGQIFTDKYPPEAAAWCNRNRAYIERTDKGYEIVAVPDPTLDELKAAKLNEINGMYDAATSSLVSTYPLTELLTFDKQEKEARSWNADNAAATPFLDGLALARGIDKAELVRRVIAKSDAFQTAVATLTGLRQRFEDQIAMATTAEEVDAIVPVYDI